MILKEIKKETESKMQKTIESVSREFSEVRTGRAHPGLIEGMHVDYYGTPTMLKQMASITIPDPRTIVIQPWDATAIPEIEKAINNSKLGVSPTVDGKLVRINIPQLSKERRDELAKMVKDMAEQGRISLRSIRRDANDRIKKEQGQSSVSEDDAFRAQDEVQKLTDKYIAEIDGLLAKKDKDLHEIH